MQDPDRYKVYDRRHYERHRLDFLAAVRRRRGLLVAGTVTASDLRRIYARHRGRCWICRRSVSLALDARTRDSAEFDHVIPLTRGGKHEPVNLRLSCGLCNRKKYNLMPTPALLTRIRSEVLALTA